MLSAFIRDQSDYILFCHGLAFALLSAACVMRRREVSDARAWNPLALFAAFHGVAKWVDLWLPLSGDVISHAIRLCLSTAALTMLVAFARRASAKSDAPRRDYRAILLTTILAIVSSMMGGSGVGVFGRYAVGLAAGLWAALAMFQQSRREGRSNYAIKLAASAMALYALAGGVTVSRARFGSMSTLDSEAILDAAGVLVQAAGAVLAVLLSASIWRSCGTAMRREIDLPAPKHRSHLLGWMMVTTFIVAIGGWANTEWDGRKEAAGQRRSILLRAVTAGAAVDFNRIAALGCSPDDATRPDYLALRRLASDIRGANPDVRFVYLLRMVDGKLYFQADSEPENSKDFSPPGSAYDDGSDELKGIFSTGKPIVEGPLADEYGTWVSGLAPVAQTTGGPVIAVLGMDIDATVFQTCVASARSRAIGRTCLLFTLLIAMFVFLAYLTRAADHLRHAAMHDALTELPNRKLFVECISRAIDEGAENRQFAVMFMDVDRFKVVNDSLGHFAGDQLLLDVSRRLRCWATDSCASTGKVARVELSRMCSDEFGVILHGVSPADALDLANQLQKRLSEPFNLQGLAVHSGASVGIVLANVVEGGPEDLIRAADTAMYRSKSAGGARCTLFDNQMHSQAVVRLQLENDLREAIERREFRVVYQPIVSLQTGQVDSFEALVRWEHPLKGMIGPDRFIPVAEETGLIVPIGAFVLQEALRQLAELRLQFPDVPELSMSVNLSKRQLIEETLVDSIVDALAASGVAPHLLKLEVTESVVMEHAEAVTPILAKLKSLGVKLAMDDFGTGHSSLSCLHRFPVDCLKIDRAFVTTMGLNRQYAAIVHAIVTLAHNLGMVVVAEGIETAEQLVLLQSLECELGQGYFFSKPVSPKSLPALLTTNNWPLKTA